MRKGHDEAREMPLLLAQKARRRGKGNGKHSKQASQVSAFGANVQFTWKMMVSRHQGRADEERS